ncbi:MAG: phosphonate ABC transporter, permease protein PhnE [Candidatus Tectomicrobia bacterium]|nr:phosphonate ABC transporter, permease protein PhnE [Candidatus Tectomicrobia bacterium]
MYSHERNLWPFLIVAVMAGLFLWSLTTIEMNFNVFFTQRGLKNFTLVFFDLFPIDSRYLPSVWESALDTLRMATVGTIIAACLAFPISFLCASNLHKHWAFRSFFILPLKLLLNLFRSVDSLIWALLFVGIVGFGPTAGVIAITLHNFGSFTKLFYETIEGIDLRPVEAVEAIGARKMQVITFAVLPDILPAFLSTILYLWEYNFRSSQVLGIVGAGGLGLLINNAIGLYDWPKVGAIFLLIIVMVTIFDQVSYYLRKKLGSRI